jgi:hypothetical protein
MNNSKSLSIVAVAAIAAMLVATSLVGTTDVFAGKKKYEKSQAISQANACGNGELALDVYCQNINSQIQGEENSAALSGFQG